MVRKKVVIRDSLGLHLRPAKELCQRALRFESSVMLCFRNREYNAKSVLGLLSACVQSEDEIELVCTGPDEQEALDELTGLLEHERQQ